MTKTAMIRARIEPRLKTEAEVIFRRLGLSATEAINLFYSMVRLKKGIPFDLMLPNATTRRAIEEANRGRGLKSHKNKEDLFQDLGIR